MKSIDQNGVISTSPRYQSDIKNVPIITHNSVPVVTTEMLADFYGSDVKNLQMNHLRNTDRFELGKHFFKLEGPELKQFKNQPTNSGSVQKRTSSLILWTERGAARHAKMLETDKAWEVFEQLEECYFNKKEQQASVDPMAVLNDPAAMRGLLLNYSEKVIALEHKVEEAKPVIESFNRISLADGSLNMTEAAKVLQVKPIVLRKHLHANRWIYRRNGAKNWLGYQDRIQSGLIEHKISVYEKDDGTQGVSEQVRITPKGITKLALEFAQGDAA